jgi:hypothetical protein
MIAHTIFGVVAAAVLTFAPALAQQQNVRVRGTIVRVDGPVLTVKSRDGETLSLALSDDVKIVAMVEASLADIKPGSFVGTTALPQSDGRWRAVEVHILPEAMRGVGEGDRPNDYRPQSTMTNGTVGSVAGGPGGAMVAKTEGAKTEGVTLTLNYKEGEKKIDVVTETIIYTYAQGSRDELKAGAIVTAAGTRQNDGTLMAARINVARGIIPPM